MPLYKHDVIGSTPIIGATAGSLLFAGVNGVFQQDNANLFWDDTNNSFGLGTATPNANYFLDINSSSALDKDRVINIVHANNADEASDVITIVNTVAPGTIGAGRTLQNINLSLTPTVTITTGRSLAVYGVENVLDISSVTLSTSNNNSLSAFGFDGNVTGAPVFNTTGTGQTITVAGVNFVTSVTPTLTAMGTGAQFVSYGAKFANLSASNSTANLSTTAYGGHFGVTGAVGTSGTTLKIGGYFIASGTADDNYGVWVDTTTGATNNYGLRLDAAATNTLWISGNADNATAAAGITFGSSKDTNIYRSAANTLATDDSLTIGGGTVTLSVDTNFVLTGGVNGMSIDGTTFSVDATNDRVGIGTAAPGSKFQVNINDSGTTFEGSVGQEAFRSQNDNNTANNWISQSYYDGVSGLVAAAFGVQLTDHTNGYGLMNWATRSATTGFSVKLKIAAAGIITMSAYGAGAATFDASGNISSVSDERLKDIQGNFTPGLQEVLKIDPILYKWKEVSGLETEHTYAGFSAQNVQASIGEYGVGVNNEGMLSLQDRAVMASLVNAVKELTQRLGALEGS